MSEPPKPDPYTAFPGRVGRTIADSEPWWPAAAQPPRGAPNVVMIIADDMGFADIRPFGAEIDTPWLDGLAANGQRLTNYHTAPLCSPSRAALLTGLNPHRAGFGSVANIDPGFPGYTMELSASAPTLAETLRAAGYATYAVGKWHLTRDADLHPSASRSAWPLQHGFDRYYGVMEGLSDFFHPHQLVSDNSPVDVERYPDDYYLTDDYTDHAITMIKELRAHEATKPFFLYFAHSAVHGPLQAKRSDIDKYRGRYDEGWDRIRDERFARQRASGMFDDQVRMAPRNSERWHEVAAWQDQPADQRTIMARHMEVYAAMVDNMDQNLGRLLATLDETGERENTLIIFVSDNGATGVGGPKGSHQYFKTFVRARGLPSDWNDPYPMDIDLIGGPRSMIQYPRGWAMASNTPFRLYKFNTHAGGVRVPFVISWPAGLPSVAGQSSVRTQYQYVTDVMPTILELVGVERTADAAAPALDGSSFVDVLRDAHAPGGHHEQYSEQGGNRSFYRDGWKLVTLHQRGTPVDDDTWELYDIRTDPTELDDLAARMPDKVQELRDAWERAAWANGVFPFDDGSGRMAVMRRPDEGRWERPVRLTPGTPPLERYRSARLIAFRDFAIDVELVHETADQGVLVAHGGQSGGYSLYVLDGHLHFAYNAYGAMHSVDAGRLAVGNRRVQVLARAIEGFRWAFSILIDDIEKGHLAGVPMLVGMAPWGGISVGKDPRSPVAWDLYERFGSFPYGGHIAAVTYRPGARAPYDPKVVLGLLHEIAETFE